MKATPETDEKAKLHPFLKDVGDWLDQRSINRTVLDKYVPDASHELRRNEPITDKRAAKLIGAIWAFHQNPKETGYEGAMEQSFWRVLSIALTWNKPFPSEAGFDTFHSLFLARLGLGQDDEARLLQLFSPYLGTMADDCWQLVTRGVIEDNTNPLRLGQVYVSLDTKTPRPRQNDEPELTREAPRNLTALEALFETETDEPTRRVVLVGEPGSGKSTFFQFVNLCLTYKHSRADSALAKKHFADLDQRVPECLRDLKLFPFRILLREFAPGLAPAQAGAEDVVNHLKGPMLKLGYTEAADKLPEALERGLAFVLFDGLDEAPKNQVAAVKQAITAFAQGKYQKCRVAVTCRTESYKKSELKLAGFPTPQEIASFASDLQIEFVRTWYKEMEQTQPQFRGQGDACATTLIKALASDRLRAMAGNPFFLTAMAALHRPDRPLPDAGAKLMDALVKSVLEESRAKRAEGDDAANALELQLPSLLQRAEIELDDLRSFLELIAYQAREKRQDKRSRFVDDALLRSELAFSDKVKAEEWLDALRHRAGLLQTQDGRNFEFAYRFEEFLAGCYLAKSNAWTGDASLAAFHLRALDLLAKQEDYARLVVLWAAGFLAHVQTGERVKVPALVSALLPETGVVGEPALLQLDLAADIARDARMEEWKERLVPGTQAALGSLRSRLEEVRDGEKRFDAKARARAASAIGRLGDSRSGIGLTKDGLPKIDWIEIPRGKCIMGGNESWQSGREFKHEIKTAYRISRYPITVAQYQVFVDARGYGNPKKERPEWWTEAGWAWRKQEKISGPENYDLVFQTPNHPRVGVSWFEAAAFCGWLTERLREKNELIEEQEIRPPSEAEWERAARGTDGRAYPWGKNEPTGDHCNWQKSGIGHTSAVGLFPKGNTPCESGNQHGLADLSGNVWEWCRTKWLDSYKDYEKNVRDDREGEDFRVLRGGSWGGDGPKALLASHRINDFPGLRYVRIGFRVVAVCG